MRRIAILGFGVVGSGVAEVVEQHSHKQKAGSEISVKRILEIRDVDSPYSHLFTKDFNDILNDDEISIVCETMGGLKFAYPFTKQLLQHGKSVVTSNKELVATHGCELLKIAKENNCSYQFEASVGGGIPVIRPLNNCLAANEIHSIIGILNGTTNFILTQMIKNNVSFAHALADAQKKGYAEADPTADIEGIDTCRKIAILSNLAYGKELNCQEIPTEGISKITLDDLNYAKSKNMYIKLVGLSYKKEDGSIYIKVAPVMLDSEHPLAGIDDVYNGVLVYGSVSGDVMFYGRGAGKLPTASAVVADVIDIVRHGANNTPFWTDGGIVSTQSQKDVQYYLRVCGADCKKVVADIFDDTTVVASGQDMLAFITANMSEKDILFGIEKVEKALGEGSIVAKIQKI